jgi:hypothetical protein
VAELVNTCLPLLPRAGCVRLLLHLRALMMGMFQRSEKPQIIQRMAGEDERYAVFLVNFETEFTFAAEALIEGYLKLHQPPRARK